MQYVFIEIISPIPLEKEVIVYQCIVAHGMIIALQLEMYAQVEKYQQEHVTPLIPFANMNPTQSLLNAQGRPRPRHQGLLVCQHFILKTFIIRVNLC